MSTYAERQAYRDAHPGVIVDENSAYDPKSGQETHPFSGGGGGGGGGGNTQRPSSPGPSARSTGGLGYNRGPNESVEEYVDRIRREAAQGLISSGPGGTLVQHAIDSARGFGAGSGGRPENRQQSVADSFFASLGTDPVYQAANDNQQIYLNPNFSGGPLRFGVDPNVMAGGSVASPATTAQNSGMPQTTAQTSPNPATTTPTITPGMDPNEFEKARQSILYNLQNPEFALTNALQSKGLSIYNPIIRRGILPAAQGLGTAYTVQQAQNPNAGPGTDVAGGFQNFINSALSGAAGGIRGVTGSAMSQLGNLGSTLWNAANAQNAGSVPTNPFIGALLSSLYDPQALIGMETSLAMPNLGGPLTSGLQELLGLKANQAWNQIQPTENFYKYLTP